MVKSKLKRILRSFQGLFKVYIGSIKVGSFFFILAPVEWAFMRNGAKLETYKVVQGALRRIF